MIDRNPEMIDAMKRYRIGDKEAYHKAEDAFLQKVKQSGQDHCPCTVACGLHGDCKSCVLVHRAHSEHLPVCFHPMVNDHLYELSALTEHSFKKPE